MKKYLFISLSILLTFPLIRTQEMPYNSFDIKVQSPTAAQFSRYDELPVNECTGIPNIAIPVYKIAEDGFELPLTLTYHAGGIKVNQDASWVGLGWDLTIGSIIQEVKGLDDLDSFYSHKLADYMSSSSTPYGYRMLPLPPGYGKLSDGYQSNIPIENVKAEYGNILSIGYRLAFWGTYKQDEDFFHSNNDTEPDIFKMTINGVTIKFLVNWITKSCMILNKKGYNISIKNNQWIVKTPMGETLYFNDFVEAKSHTSTTDDGAGLNKLSMRIWMLNKVVTKTGKEITVSYSRSTNKVTSTIKNHEYRYKLDSDTRSSNFVGGGKQNLCYHVHTSSKIGLNTITTVSNEDILYIDKITFPKGIISFIKTARTDIANTQKLDMLSISNGIETIRKISFTYDYFAEKGYNTGKRLKLLSVKNGDELYSFAYNNTLLPSKNSFNQDYWGYNNGKNNSYLIPNPSRFGYSDKNGVPIDNFQNMSADLNHCKSAILEEITYPSKGKVCFDYELNQFTGYKVPDMDSLNNKISKGNGLRVKTVTYKDETGKIVKKTAYEYAIGKSILKFSMINRYQRKFYIGPTYITPCDTKVRYDDILHITVNGFSSSNPLSSMSGIAYDKVIKYETNNNTKINGKTETEYHVNADNISGVSFDGGNVFQTLNLPAFKNLREPENGSIKSVKYFNINNELLKKVNYEYKNIVSQIYYGIKTSGYASMYYCPASPTNPLPSMGTHIVGFYPIVDLETIRIEKNEEDYVDGNTVPITEIYTYNSYNLIKECEYRIRGYYQHKTAYTYHPVNIAEITKIIRTGNKPYTFSRSFYYVSGYYLLSQESLSHSDQNVILNEIPVTYYELYNEKLSLRQKMDSKNMRTCYLWGYKGQYPIAVIENAKYSEVSPVLTKLGLSEDNLMTSINLDETTITKLRKLKDELPKAQVTIYTYKPLIGILTETDSRGVVTFYDYDSSGRLICIKDHNGKILRKLDYNYINQ